MKEWIVGRFTLPSTYYLASPLPHPAQTSAIAPAHHSLLAFALVAPPQGTGVAPLTAKLGIAGVAIIVAKLRAAARANVESPAPRFVARRSFEVG